MSDYSTILPEDDHELQKFLSSCQGSGNATPYDIAYLDIDDGTVSLRERTRYGSNDAIPIEVWHNRVLWYDLPGGVKARWLREELKADGTMAELLDRIIVGHSIDWDGSNNVGQFNDNAQDASDALIELLQDAPRSDLVVMTAEEWIYGDMSAAEVARTIKELGETPESLLQSAEQDGDIVISDGLAGIREAVKEVFERAKEEEQSE